MDHHDHRWGHCVGTGIVEICCQKILVQGGSIELGIRRLKRWPEIEREEFKQLRRTEPNEKHIKQSDEPIVDRRCLKFGPC